MSEADWRPAGEEANPSISLKGGFYGYSFSIN